MAPLKMAENPGAKAATEELINELMDLGRWAGKSLEDATAKWREAHGGITVASLYDVDPMELAPLVDQIRDWKAKQEAAAETRTG